MSKRGWQPIYTSVAIAVITLAIAAVVLGFLFSEITHQQLEASLIEQALTIRSLPAVTNVYGSGGSDSEALIRQIERATGVTLTLYQKDGSPLTASPSASAYEQKPRGPEMRAALNGEIGIQHIRSPGKTPMTNIALPMMDGDDLIGVIHISQPTPGVARTNQQAVEAIVFVFVGLAAASSAIMLLYSSRGTANLRKLTAMVDRIAGGDMNARVLTLRYGEVGQLARSLNQMADRLQSQTRKRRREKDRLNTVMRTMNDGIIILSRYGEVRLMNPAAAHILGVSLRRSHGMSFVQVARDFHIAALWEACQETNVEQSDTIELTHDAYVQVVITPFLKRHARGYLVMIQDLTQLRHLQTVRQDFVSNVSHELRTPLASLRALVETLRDGALEDPPAARRFLDRMEIEVDALTQMVQELMELSRIESGQAPLELTPVRPLDVVTPAVERLRMQAERAGVALTVDVSASLPSIMADPQRAQQIVTNLVHNAIKFTPEGGDVLISARPEGSAVQVVVHDTGIGIAQENLERVFERFYKVDPSRSHSGTGLGLSIASHLVHAHGGDIWVDSVEGEWSEFGFSFPLAEEIDWSPHIITGPAVNGAEVKANEVAEVSGADLLTSGNRDAA